METTSHDADGRQGIAERVTTLRKSKNMSQADLATAMSVSRSAVAQWETGRASMTMKNFDRLADILGVSKSYIISGEIGESGLSIRERKLIVAFRVCARTDQDAVLRIVNGLKAA
jgi:transcriptional regulator with XRE-family HTH domain